MGWVKPVPEARLGRLRQIAVAICAHAFVLLLPVHAAGPPDLEVGPAQMPAGRAAEEAAPQPFPMEEFLERLMMAESRGHLRTKNPRSTALGPFQFIESTFLLVARKSFTSEVAGLTERQILALRTNLAFARRAAAAYAGDLISTLADNGLPATPVNVRLAFLVGPAAAVRLLKTPPDQPLEGVLSADAIAANPYMSGVTVAQLVQRAAADMRTADPTGQPGTPKEEPATEMTASTGEPAAAEDAANLPPTATLVALRSGPAGAAALASGEAAGSASAAPIEVRCDVSRASCRRWIALRERRTQLGSAQP